MRKPKPYTKMTLAELRAATAEHDGPTDLSKTAPLGRRERARFAASQRATRARAARRRAVVVDLDATLIRQSDAYADAHGITRSELLTQSLRSFLKDAARTKRAG